MAALTMHKTYVLELTTPELLLVLKALGGRIVVNSDEELMARSFGNRLTEIRGKLLKQAERDGVTLETATNS